MGEQATSGFLSSLRRAVSNVHLYPKGEERDLWEDLREEVDDGYEKIGEYKDIFDMPEEKVPRLPSVMSLWPSEPVSATLHFTRS